MTEKPVHDAVGGSGDAAPRGDARQLSPAAQRALAEAEARRAQMKEASGQPVELNGRGGQDPARYGDWEVKGIASDF
jgi:hypothetical protein